MTICIGKQKCNLKCLKFGRSLSYDADVEDYIFHYSALLLLWRLNPDFKSYFSDLTIPLVTIKLEIEHS